MPRVLKPCGTPAAYHRHLQTPHLGPPCPACRRANADRHAAIRRRKTAALDDTAPNAVTSPVSERYRRHP